MWIKISIYILLVISVFFYTKYDSNFEMNYVNEVGSNSSLVTEPDVDAERNDVNDIKAIDKDEEYTHIELNGNWYMGNKTDIGKSAKLVIKNADKDQFEFSIDALYVGISQNEDGEEFQNPHMGDIKGIAFFSSRDEAYFTLENYPDYKLIFTMNDVRINVSEINVEENIDYGRSPMSGVNVRYSGDYIKK